MSLISSVVMLSLSCFFLDSSLFIILFIFLFMLICSKISLSMFWNLLFVNSGEVGSLMIYLSAFVFLVLVASVAEEWTSESSWFLKLVISSMFLILIIYFSSMEFFCFYITFEVSLVPIFLIILGWGYQVERFFASLMMMFYTLMASLPLLFVLVYSNKWLGSSSIIMLKDSGLNLEFMMNWWVISMVLAFLVKTPMFIFHSWLPKAHVEAPVYGSILLAALLLKLGTYGMYLVCFFLSVKVFFMILSISCAGLVVINMICLRVMDMKMIIALSSVSHMGMVLGGLSLNSKFLLLGSLYLMVAHGVSSSLLFFGANVMYYRCHSRMLLLNKGIMAWMPTFSLFWFLTIMINIAGPPSINLLSELYLIMGLLSYYCLLSVYIFFSVLSSTGYSLMMFSVSVQGWELYYFDKVWMENREMIFFFSMICMGFFSLIIFMFFI